MIVVFGSTLLCARVGYLWVLQTSLYYSSFIVAVITISSGVFGLLLGFFLADWLGKLFQREWQLLCVKQLHAIQVEATAKRLFLLVAANKRGLLYNYCVETPVGLEMHQLPVEASHVLITKITSGGAPYLEVQRETFVHKWTYLLALPASELLYRFVLPTDSFASNVACDFSRTPVS